MTAPTDRLISHVAAHAGIDHALAERVTREVLAALGGYLSAARRQLVAEELPGSLGAAVLAGADLAVPVEQRVLGLTTSVGHARELIASVCRGLAEALSSEAVAAIRASIPAQLAVLLERAPDGELAPHAPSSRVHETIASGHPGSAHPVSDARGRAAQTESIAADNPHAATKLSSTSGSTQERHHETLAEGRPGTSQPLSGPRR